MISRAALLAVTWATVAAAAPAEAPLAAYARVNVAPAKTSIYVGSVRMTMPVFTRENGVYHSTYEAKLVPYIFLNESGRLQIDMSDAQLRQLERGEAVDFTGRGVRTDGAERRVSGRATPIDKTSGRIKVRVFVSKRVELIFNSTYKFVEPAAVDAGKVTAKAK